MFLISYFPPLRSRFDMKYTCMYWNYGILKMCFKSQYLLHSFWFSASKWHFPSPYCQSEGARVFSILWQSCLGPLWLNTNWLRCFWVFLVFFPPAQTVNLQFLLFLCFYRLIISIVPPWKKVHHDHRVNRALLWHFKRKKKKKMKVFKMDLFRRSRSMSL